MIGKPFRVRHRGLGRCNRGAAALEFALAAVPLLLLLFGFVATNMVFHTWADMQNSAQYAARLMSTGQVTQFRNGTITTSNNTVTTVCGGTLTSAQVEYYACKDLPNWSSFTVTATENCATPSVTVSISTSAATAAVLDVFLIFTGKTLVAKAVMMKEGLCP